METRNMFMREHLEGLLTAPFATMNEDGSINLELIEKHAEILRHNNIKGVFVNGTTGEGMSLTIAERFDIVEQWIKVAPKELKVIVHAGHTCINSCKEIAVHAQKVGAYAVGVMGPCFFKPATVDDLVDFTAEVAAETPELPFYYYHMPSLTGVNFLMIDYLKAAANKIPNLAGIKFTHENLMDFERCREFDGGRFDMVFGRDEILICALALGVRAAIGSTYNFAAPLYYDLIKAFDSGDLDTARKLQRKSIDMIQLFIDAPCSFLSAAKSTMKMLGVDCGPMRPPEHNITVEQYGQLKNQLDKIGFFDYCCK